MDEKYIIVGGQYAVEQADDLPPLEHMRFLDEKGNFTEERPASTEELSYYWRKQERVLFGIILFCSLGLLLLLLASTEQYASGVWIFLSETFWFFVHFVMGLLPEGVRSWIPF